MTASVIQTTEERFRMDPAAAQATPAVTATLANGRARLSAGAFNWEADLGPALGGGGLAPSPTQYLLGALAGCAVAFLWDTLAPQLGVQLHDVTAIARCGTDSRGLLGMAEATPDLASVELEISVSTSDSPERIRELERVWLERCPIYLAIAKPNPITVRLTAAVPPAAVAT